MTHPFVPISRVQQARRDANRVRAHWLAALHEGLVTPVDLFRHAATMPGRPLLSLTLRQVLTHTRGHSPRATNHMLRRILVGEDPVGVPTRGPTVGWLLDTRVRGRRLARWVSLQPGASRQPWAGFPFTAPPTNGGRGHDDGLG